MIKLLFLSFILTSTAAGAFWPSYSPHHHHHHHHQVSIKDGHRIVIKFEEETHGNNKVSISEPEDSRSRLSAVEGGASGRCSAFDTLKSAVASAVGKPGEKAISLIGKVADVGKMIGNDNVQGTIEGALKDSVVKLEDWDLVDSPKRIGEDIRQNASKKIEEGVEEVKETVESVVESSPEELVSKSKMAMASGRLVVGWFHLVGFSTAYGMGVWVTFFSEWVLGKCLPKQEVVMMLNMMKMVYCRVMGCCVGVALFGFLASQGTRVRLSNRMEMFQGFNLVSALVMVLTNLVFLEPRATKFIAQRMNGTKKTRSKTSEKLKKINTCISTLNVSTMVVLTWHLAYFSQLLRARH